MVDVGQVVLIIGFALFLVESFVLAFIIFGLGGIPLTLFKAKIKKQVIAIVEGNDRTRSFQLPEIKDGFMTFKEFGQVLLTPEKIIPLKKTDLQTIWISPNLPEGVIVSDVKHGFIDSPQMIERYNERMSDALALKKINKDPKQMMMQIGLVAAIILAIGITGYIIINALSNVHFCSVQVGQVVTKVTSTLPNIILPNGTITPPETGIY